MTSRKPYLLFAGILLLVLACSPTSDRDPGHLVVHFLNEPTSLHPIAESNSYTNQVNALCHQGLILIDPVTGKLIPELAVSLPEKSEDGLSHTYEILPEANWPDGSPITAKDAEFSFKLLAFPLIKSGQRAAVLETVSSVTVDTDNPRRLRFDFTEYSINNGQVGAATILLDPRLYDPQGLLEPYRYAELKNDTTLSRDTALAAWANRFNDVQTGMNLDQLNQGSGPYIVQEWIPKQQIILVPRPANQYWARDRSEPHFARGPQKLIFKIINDDKLAELQFKQQELDLSYMMSTRTYNALQESEEVLAAYNVKAIPRNNYAFIALNNNADGNQHSRLFQDKTLRRALTYALPINQIIEEIYPGVADRATSPVPTFHPDYNPNVAEIPYDLDEAKRLLEASGWIDTDGDRIRDKVVGGQRIPLTFTMMYPPNGQDLITMAERIQEEWKKVGVDCQIDGKTFSEILPKIYSGDYDASMIALRTPPTPYDFTQIFYSQSEGNFMGYVNTQADELMLEANRTRDENKRKELVDQVQEILYEDQPCIFFFTATRKIALHKRFGDVPFYSNDPFVLFNALTVQGNWEWDGSKWVEK
jgi:peptide/nickel transport system substrate-binding protein